MRRAGSFLFALLLAVLFALVGPVPVGAQAPRFLGGPLFFMSEPGHSRSAVPGGMWTVTQLRADPDWGAATSFPERVWERQVSGAPPNDACFGEGDVAVTDLDTGPYGLETVQYLADWWEGQVYWHNVAAHGAPAGWDYLDFGLFSFDFQHSSGRALVDPNGVVGSLPGNPGACVGNYLSRQRGDSAPWETRQRHRDGGPCYSEQHIFRLRFNTELRCEPDLAVQDSLDPFTARFWDAFRAAQVGPQPLLPDGSVGATWFPNTYVGHYAWFRRVDSGFHKWIYAAEAPGATAPLSAVFTATAVPGGPTASIARSLGAPLDYYDHHAWRFAGLTDPAGVDPGVVRANERNALVTLDALGAVADPEQLVLFDSFDGTTDCLSFSGLPPGSERSVSWPCLRPNSELPAVNSLQAGRRVVDLGALDYPDLQSRGLPAVSLLTVADASRQPAPAHAWLEWRDWALECTWFDVAVLDLVDAARRAVDSHDFSFWHYWNTRENLDPAQFPSFARYESTRQLYYDLAQVYQR